MATDFIVIGSGLAGLTSALILKDFGHVLLVTKKKLDDSASNLAQGGIAAVVLEQDSFESHIKDTLIAGAGHNDKDAVEYLVRHAPGAINWLVKQGVMFATRDGKFDPTREAAHSFPRVLHSTDITGREIEKVLISHIKKEKNITVWEDCVVTELIANHNICYGVKVIHNLCHCEPVCAVREQNQKRRGNPITIKNNANNLNVIARSSDNSDAAIPLKSEFIMIEVYAKATVLATGGLGQLYEWTTNPKVSTGDGIALANRAGAMVQDLEFIQFHPTALKPAPSAGRYGKSPLFLLSEALRGEGGYLVRIKNLELRIKNDTGERFMEDYDKRGELAPRDIVARAIFNEQQKGYNVYLDIRNKGKEYLLKRFPGIYKELKKRGYDLSSDLIPVTPAAHYSCGGVKVDLYGRSSIKNLFAFGEVACTGVHGANRLASNSLLEAVVFPLRLKEKSVIPTEGCTDRCVRVEGSSEKQLDNTTSKKEIKKINSIRQQLQHLMWEKAGIVRTEKGLKEALEEINKLELESNVIARSTMKSRLSGIHDAAIPISSGTSSGQSRWDYRNLIETQNMLSVAKLICQSALKRKSSLGAHWMNCQ